MNFKLNKESERLEGFEKKFHDAIMELATVLCESTGAKPKELKVAYSGDEEKLLIITASVDIKDLDMNGETVENYVYVLCGHFPAFFTPSHYRPYIQVEPSLKSGDYLDIVGMYDGGV